MLATIHFAVGALIGKFVAPWPWAFLGAFLSHFLLDAVLHTDPGTLKEPSERGKLNVTDLSLAFGDLALALGLLLGLSRTVYFTDNVLAGAIGGITPDFSSGLFWAWPALKEKPPFSWYEEFHRRVQRTAGKKDWLIGLLIEITIAAGAVYLFLQ